MTRKGTLVILLVVMSLMVVGCGNDTDDAPDVGEETLDELVEETVDVVETAVSTACALCTAVNGDDLAACCGVCD